MKLRANVDFDELLKYGFKKETATFSGYDHVFIRYRYVVGASKIEIFPFDISGNEDRSLFIFEEANGIVADDVLDKLNELIVAGLIEAPKPILLAPKPVEIDEETFTRFWTMVRGALEKSLEACGLVVKLITNDEKEQNNKNE